MNTLAQTYTRLTDILGPNIEALEAVQLVHEYREYWRPETVKIILLAESHVFTSTQDMEIRFQPPLPGYPTNYAKFVYCLAHGERELTGNTRHPTGDGTPQFWKMLYACAYEVSSNQDFSPILAKTPFPKRLENKISLLQTLRERGVWLVDTSIVALYHKGVKPDRVRLARALECSWQCYTFDVVSQCAPAHVICVGKGVGDIVGGGLRRMMGDHYTVLPQPNARLSSAEHMHAFRTYYRVCSEHFSH